MNESKIIVENRYVISKKTMMIEPMEKEGKILSKVYEEKEVKIVDMSPRAVIMESCRRYGSTLTTESQVAIKMLNHVKQKPPISVNRSEGIFFFPTMSPKKETCTWISHAWIEKFHKQNTSNTTILFRNQCSYTVPFSLQTISKQYLRTAQLRIAPQLYYPKT